MLTIFTIPLPFEGGAKISQPNAILSWILLRPEPEIILLGDEPGVADFAAEHGLRHSKLISHTEDGFLSVKSMFQEARWAARNDILALVDADVILMDDFVSTVAMFAPSTRFLLAGYRRAISQPQPLDFSPGWDHVLCTLVNRHGKRFNPKSGAGSDYFVFHKDLANHPMPDFSLGRGHWDGWWMWHALNQGCELVDCTDSIYAVHQNHPWRVWRGEGSQRNLDLAGDRLRWLFDATARLED